MTASIYKSIAAKLENVLFNYYPFIDWQHVIICCDKQMIKCDVMVDDGVHNLIGGDYEKILITAPYNEDFNADSFGMYRADDWDKVYELITLIGEYREYQDYVGVKG